VPNLRAQQPAAPVIGFLSPSSSEMFAERLRGFRQGLRDTGYVEGENVAIVYHLTDGQYDHLPELAAELVRRQVAVIVTAGGAPSTLAPKAATTTIPIVFNAAEDPVRLGLVASLARTGGNLIGVNFFITELTAKRMELLRELVPGAIRVAVLVNPAIVANSETTSREVEAAARAAVRNSLDHVGSGGDSEKVPFPWHALESVHASVLERDARADHQVLHGA
jgi:putative ABC transport system substrate-binding protein